MTKQTQNARAEAAILLAQVITSGKTLTEVFSKLTSEKQSLIQELCYGTIRWYEQLAAISKQLLQKAFNKKDADVQALLLIGLYQILHLRIPDHAAVTETVEAARILGKPWSTKLLNAVLRRFIREQETILAEINKNPTSRYAHPHWLLTRLQQAWPKTWEEIITTNNTRPPMTLRVNPLQVSSTHYLQKLKEAGIDAEPAAYTENGIVLKQPCAVTQLPGFADGWVSIQDAGAQIAATLLDVKPGETVLDACAAPGGKTTQILELTPDLSNLTAIDIDTDRLSRLEENLQRLGFSGEEKNEKIKILTGDICQISSPSSCDEVGGMQNYKRQTFDRILLDVPCSATGVIRRHPDIKLLRRNEDIDKLQAQQQAILKACWLLLKPGGRMLYVTCSILPEENQQQIIHFLSQHADAQEIPIKAEWGIPCSVGRQVLPGMHNMDGFYYARLEKSPQ